jgi:hypothetical protein
LNKLVVGNGGSELFTSMSIWEHEVEGCLHDSIGLQLASSFSDHEMFHSGKPTRVDQRSGQAVRDQDLP